MAAIPVTYVGQDQDGKDFRFVGMMSLTGFQVGGGPMPGGPDKPPGVIWPDPGPLPGVGHPIVLPGDPSWEPPVLPPDQGGPATKYDWQLHATYNDETGWSSVIIGLPKEGTPIPTPSKA